MEQRLPDGLSLLIRTDFSDEGAWREVLHATASGDEPFYPQFVVVNDQQFDGVGVDALIDVVRDEPNYRSYVFVADRRTMTDPEHPVLVVRTVEDVDGTPPGQTFRVTQPEIESVEANLSIANQDFRDFVEFAGKDGVFRGFPAAPKKASAVTFSVDDLRELVARKRDIPVFAALLQDLTVDVHAPSVVRALAVDVDVYRGAAERSTGGWVNEWVEEFVRDIDGVRAADSLQVSLFGRYGWNVLLDSATSEPIAAYKQVRV
ncbi:MAG: hypothetical protein GX542_08270 [Rhodococcus sp.]|nr:hypothetical protein [Rhodococcus sp. (in: high G+C Gram-positive bacteria)]